MTDIIDLATLASLGQHFSSQEDVAELKGTLASVQNDLSLIKNFLLQQFGTKFATVLKTEEVNQHQSRSDWSADVAVNKKIKLISHNKTKVENQVVNGFAAETSRSQQQQRPKPPPLQRFRRVNSSSDEGSSNLSLAKKLNKSGTTNLMSNVSSSNAQATTTVKPEKFHRNFLSMGSLGQNRFKRASGIGGNSVSTSGSGSLLLSSKNINGGLVKAEPLSLSTGARSVGNSGTAVVSRMSRLNQTAQIMQKQQGAIMEETYEEAVNDDEEFNVSEGAYAAVAITEDGNNGIDEAVEDEMEYATYGDYQDQEDAEYFEDSMNPIAYQEEEEDSTPYEYDYSMEGFDDNSFIGGLLQNSSLRVLNGNRRSIAGAEHMKKMVPQRRLSLPAAATTTSSTANFEDNMSSGGVVGDPNFLKKCKVCHAEVPSYSLFNHVVAVHYKGEVPTCSICKKTFTYKQGLISHMRYHDAEKYDKACSYCGKKFIRRSDVIIHERRLHTGERPFHCPVPDCNQGFVRRYCLLTHVKTNHGEPYMSQIVGRRRGEDGVDV